MTAICLAHDGAAQRVLIILCNRACFININMNLNCLCTVPVICTHSNLTRIRFRGHGVSLSGSAAAVCSWKAEILIQSGKLRLCNECFNITARCSPIWPVSISHLGSQYHLSCLNKGYLTHKRNNKFTGKITETSFRNRRLFLIRRLICIITAGSKEEVRFRNWFI